MTANGTNAIDILLSESFKEIASTRPIEKITIKEITDKAGVIRPTFYNHFQDKYELLEWIVKKELIEPMLDKYNDGLSREGVLLAFNQIEKDRAFYRNAAKLTGQNSFRDIITEDIKELLIPFINPSKLIKELPYKWITPNLIGLFFAESIAECIISWIQSGMKIEPDELIDTFIYMISHSVLDFCSSQ
jgi:probable dihydroxyacetone kinase regulator